jgi:hypothetical protein
MEMPVYAFAAWRMHQLRLIRWGREATLWLTVAAGVGVGTAVALLGHRLFPAL